MLYFVATPIGNLKDMSFRAIEVLNSVDEIACEDTRHSIKLLNHYEIKKPLFSYHKFNEKASGEKIIEKLKSGKNIAVISDAGMPVISDPGNILADMLIKEGLEFTVVPGACAFVSALVLSGLDASRFCFLGFLPEKEGERKAFLENSRTIVFLMTKNKFGSTYMHTLCNIDEVDFLFSDAEIPEEIRNKLD